MGKDVDAKHVSILIDKVYSRDIQFVQLAYCISHSHPSGDSQLGG